MFKAKSLLFLSLLFGYANVQPAEISKITKNIPDALKRYWKPVVGSIVIGGLVYKAWKSYQSRNVVKNVLNPNENEPIYKSGTSETQGRKGAMEDFHCINNLGLFVFAGVFDGHGGAKAAEFIVNNLHKNLQLSNDITDKMINENIFNAFLQTQEQLRKENVDNIFAYQGSTAVVALLNRNKIYLANLGDSRAVLCSDDKAIALSRDHKPNCDDERKRIEELGGNIIFEDNIFRILCDDRMISTSRAFGDFKCAPYVSCVPEIITHEITAKDDFLILASDGLWDKVSNDDAIKIVQSIFERGRDCQQAAEELENKAFMMGSSDNITVIVIDLKK